MIFAASGYILGIPVKHYPKKVTAVYDWACGPPKFIAGCLGGWARVLREEDSRLHSTSTKDAKVTVGVVEV